MKRRARWICKACQHQYTVTSGTIFHHAKMPLEKYRIAFEMFHKGERTIRVAEALDCNYRTAWRLRRLCIQEAENGHAQVQA